MGLTCPVVTLTPGPGTLQVDWTTISGAADYTIQVFDNSGGTGSATASDVVTGTTKTFGSGDGLAASTQYWVRVTPSDNVHTDPVCSLQSATTGSNLPTLVSIVVNSGAPSSLILTYDRTLNTASISLSKFAPTINGSSVGVSSANASGTSVTVGISTPVAHLDTVTLSYTPGTTGSRIADASANFALGFTDHAVTNNV